MDHPEEINVRAVTATVERDPLVVARLLQRVNSAYYGLSRTIDSVERAVVLLGPVAVVGMVVGMSMLRLRSVLSGPAGKCFVRLIEHSMATAYLARALAEHAPSASTASRTRSGAGFTAGLMHDFGKIILVYSFPDEAVAFYEDETLGAHLATDDPREAERLLFGADHTEAGEYAAHKLRFPEPITRTIRFHHTPESLSTGDETDRVVRAVAAANLSAQAMGFALGAETDWDALAEHPVWDAVLRDLPSFREVPRLIDFVRAHEDEVRAYVSTFATLDE